MSSFEKDLNERKNLVYAQSFATVDESYSGDSDNSREIQKASLTKTNSVSDQVSEDSRRVRSFLRIGTRKSHYDQMMLQAIADKPILVVDQRSSNALKQSTLPLINFYSSANPFEEEAKEVLQRMTFNHKSKPQS